MVDDDCWVNSLLCELNCRMKDEQAGEVPVAFVVKLKNSEVTEDEIKLFVSKQVLLTPFKILI